MPMTGLLILKSSGSVSTRSPLCHALILLNKESRITCKVWIWSHAHHSLSLRSILIVQEETIYAGDILLHTGLRIDNE